MPQALWGRRAVSVPGWGCSGSPGSALPAHAAAWGQASSTSSCSSRALAVAGGKAPVRSLQALCHELLASAGFCLCGCHGTLRLQNKCALAMPSTLWRLCRATCPGLPSKEGPGDIAHPMDLCSVHLYYTARGSGMERELITLLSALRCFLKILSTLLMEPRLPNSLNLLFFLNRLFRHNRFSVIKLIKMEE